MEVGLPLVATLAFWFLTSAGFNDVTPRLMATLANTGGLPIDVTQHELAISVAFSACVLRWRGQRTAVPTPLYPRLFFIGMAHLLGCRMFIYSLQFIPVSLAQTIRAMNPLVAVVVGTLTGRVYPLHLVVTLVPIVIGFAMAVSADLSVEPVGVACALGSVCCLVLVNQFTKRVLEDSALPVTSSELQHFTLMMALALLTPFWMFSGGAQRVADALAHAQGGAHLLGLCAVDGGFYFSEQVAQFSAINLLMPLTLAVVDTVRRLFIVVVTGFILQGNPYGASNVLGALCVCSGAVWYARVTHQDMVDKKDS